MQNYFEVYIEVQNSSKWKIIQCIVETDSSDVYVRDVESQMQKFVLRTSLINTKWVVHKTGALSNINTIFERVNLKSSYPKFNIVHTTNII